jgi:hypothetical protein
MKLSVALLCSTLALAAEETPVVRLDAKHQQLFKDTCVSCHGPDKQKGKFRIDQLSLKVDTVETAERWQKVLNQINSGEMPPEDSKQPERVAKTEFLDSLSHTLMAARRSLGDSGGMITMRRLNRREYKNTLRDLLGVDINVRELPADGGAGTFDTVGSSLRGCGECRDGLFEPPTGHGEVDDVPDFMANYRILSRQRGREEPLCDAEVDTLIAQLGSWSGALTRYGNTGPCP